MPRDHTLMACRQGWWRWQAQEELLVFTHADAYIQLDFEVLAHTAHNWLKSCLHLPVMFIIKHIQQDHSFISNIDVDISKQLNQGLFDAAQWLLVAGDLRNKQVVL